MAKPSVFAVPTGPSQYPSSTSKIALKRKRSHQDDSYAQGLHHDADIQGDSPSNLQRPAEYSAVIAPAERSQRRLAGLMLNEPLPPPPFPHGPPKLPQALSYSQRYGAETSDNQVLFTASARSLHTQHLAAMTAILHRSMITHDYHRASRAMGLILRNEIGGKAVDIRHEGTWGVAAEILLRRTVRSEGQGNVDAGHYFSRAGFEGVKNLYEALIIQHPPHKTWPDAVNAKDFCISMFGLWVYVASEESRRLQGAGPSSNEGESLVDPPTLLQVKLWETEQAAKIAEAMDHRMSSLAFRDDRELVQLRAMVALWTADLQSTCAELEEIEEMQQEHNNADGGMGDLTSNLERAALTTQPIQDPRRSRAGEAAKCRDLARTLFAKLGLA